MKNLQPLSGTDYKKIGYNSIMGDTTGEDLKGPLTEKVLCQKDDVH